MAKSGLLISLVLALVANILPTIPRLHFQCSDTPAVLYFNGRSTSGCPSIDSFGELR